MDSKKKLMGVLVLGLMVLGLGAQKGWSAETDSIQLLVTPGVTYSVKITSVNASGYDFGTVNLTATTQSTAPILVQNDGNTNAKWRLYLDSLTSGWTAAAAPGTDAYEMRALFTTTSVGQPLLTNFTDATDELVEDTFVNVAAGGTEFEEPTDGTADIDNVIPTTTRRMWLWLNMPTVNTQGVTTKAFQLSINAIAP